MSYLCESVELPLMDTHSYKPAGRADKTHSCNNRRGTTAWRKNIFHYKLGVKQVEENQTRTARPESNVSATWVCWGVIAGSWAGPPWACWLCCWPGCSSSEPWPDPTPGVAPAPWKEKYRNKNTPLFSITTNTENVLKLFAQRRLWRNLKAKRKWCNPASENTL